MKTCHEHNRRLGAPQVGGPFGLLLSLPEGDPMRNLLGDDWRETQWFPTKEDRDARIEELTAQFTYYRKGDRPTFVCQKIDSDNRPETP